MRVAELQEEQLAIHKQATSQAVANAKVTIESLIAEAEAMQGMLDRFPLWVEHAILQSDVHTRLHCNVDGPLTSVGPLSGRMPKRRATS